MSRLFAAVLLLCLLLPVGGGWLWLRHEKQLVKRSIRHQMLAVQGDNGLVKCSFSRAEASNLHWEHSHEFCYRGQMYDVVRRCEKPDSLILWCWPDHAETRLNQQLAALGVQIPHWPGQQQRRQQVQLLLKSLFFPPKPILFSAENQRIEILFGLFWAEGRRDLLRPVPAPPPRNQA